MDTSASSHLNNSVTSLSTILNSCMYSTISVGDRHSIPVTNTDHNILSTPLKSLRLNNVLMTPHIVKNLISVRQFVRDNDCTIEFDSFGFFVKDFMTRRVLLQCDSTEDLYLVTAPSPIPSAFLVSQQNVASTPNTPGHNTPNGDEAQIPSPAAHSPTVPPNITHPDIIPDPPVNPNPRVYPMVTRFRVGSNKPTQRLNFHVSSVSPLPKTYHDAFHDSNCALFMGSSKPLELGFSGLPLTLLELGFIIVAMTHLYLYSDKGLRQGTGTAYLLLYVDDIVLTASSKRLLQMFLSQRKYAGEILKRAGMVNYNPSRNPVDTESKLGANGDPVSDLTLYRSLLYMHDPREPHFSVLKRVLRYVQGTLNYGLQLFSSSTTDLIAFSDADWAGCPTTRHSTSEAEYRGVANAVAETCWLRNLLGELHTPLSFATLVYCDNVRSVYLSCNPVQHQRTKHIEIDIHFVRDLVAAGQVRVLHVPSRYQYANIFTKGLPSILFEEFRSSDVRTAPKLAEGEGDQGALLSRSMRSDHVRIMGFNLEGAVAEWFRCMTRNILITTWDRFEESAHNHFGPLKYEDPHEALSKLLQMGTVEDYQREFEKLMNRGAAATDGGDDAVESCDISILLFCKAVTYQSLIHSLVMKVRVLLWGTISKGDVHVLIDNGDESLRMKKISLHQMQALLDQDEVYGVYEIHSLAMAAEVATTFPPYHSIDHRIHLLPDTKRVNIWPYRYPQYQKDEMEKLVTEMLDQGIIRDIKAVRELSEPTTQCQVREFLRLTGYYRHLIKGYATMAAPLTDLLRKDNFNWGVQEAPAFEELKQQLSTTPVLSLPYFNHVFVVEANASANGIGADKETVRAAFMALSQQVVGFITNLKEENASLKELLNLHRQLDMGAASSGTQLNRSTTYHPQKDGQTEVVNRGLEQYLREMVSDRPNQLPLSLILYLPRSSKVVDVDELLVKRDGGEVKRIRKTAYRLAPPSTSMIHPVFHVSILKLFTGSRAKIVTELPKEFQEGQPLEQLVAICDSQLVLHTESLVQQSLVQWDGRFPEEAT
ncbi:ribonuclease H-like domain-containing protein [Tanacetum coccineum]